MEVSRAHNWKRHTRHRWINKPNLFYRNMESIKKALIIIENENFSDFLLWLWLSHKSQWMKANLNRCVARDHDATFASLINNGLLVIFIEKKSTRMTHKPRTHPQWRPPLNWSANTGINRWAVPSPMFINQNVWAGFFARNRNSF